MSNATLTGKGLTRSPTGSARSEGARLPHPPPLVTTPNPTTTRTDFRELCAELAFCWSRSTNPDDFSENAAPIIERMKAALAQPEPEDEAWQEFIEQVQHVQHVALREGEGPRFDLVECALALWREAIPPAPEPEFTADEVEMIQAPWSYLASANSLPAGHPHHPARTELDDNKREAVYAAVAEALGGAYDCLRVWSAWGCGTMGPDDFSLVGEDDDRVAEIADAAINALARPITQPVPVAERPWEREGWCDERGWCWMRRKYEPDGVTWRFMLPDPEASGYYRESLPHWALHHD